MLKKLFLLILFSIIILPAKAGEFENALNTDKPVFLYINTSWCGSCKKFNPIYNDTVKNYSSKFKFVKLDADTDYGNKIAERHNVRYIPYAALFKPKSTTPHKLSYSCMMNYACMNKTLKNF